MGARSFINLRLSHLLAAFSFLSILLYATRIFLTGNLHFGFLVWNLFLAWIPLWLSSQLMKKEKLFSLSSIALFLSWLLFFPNAPYILTDFIHLGAWNEIPKWYDALMIASFAWTGLLISFVSLRHIEEFLRGRINSTYVPLLIIGILLLTSFGIYLGRFERFNSWDVLAHPFRMMHGIAGIFLVKGELFKTATIIIPLSSFLIINYLALKGIGNSEK